MVNKIKTLIEYINALWFDFQLILYLLGIGWFSGIINKKPKIKYGLCPLHLPQSYCEMCCFTKEDLCDFPYKGNVKVTDTPRATYE